MREVEPGEAVDEVAPLTTRMSASMGQPRFAAAVLGPEPLVVIAHDERASQTSNAFEQQLIDRLVRVLDGFDLTWDVIHARNPKAIMVRMPSFGLDGPWRDRTGFAQTMEQVSGLAWVSGFRDGPPVIPRGACDPLAGMHAVVAFLAAVRVHA